jgi:hypothetical protein
VRAALGRCRHRRAPVVVPDTVVTGAASRAEIQLDYANMVRLAAATEVRFSELQYRRYQIQIARGTVTFSVVRDSDSDVDLATPNVSVRPARKGRYRIAVREDGTTEITVRSGEAEIFTPKGSESLRPGRTMVVRGTASEPEFQIVATIAEDSWDEWNQKRDKELGRSEAYRYVSRDVYGAEDVDSYGRWIYVPPCGWVWSPTRRQVGALPLRPLGLGGLVWVELDQLRPVGLGAVSLRPMVPSRQSLVLVARRLRRAPLLAARAGRLFRLGPRRVRFRRRLRLRARGMGAAGAV